VGGDHGVVHFPRGAAVSQGLNPLQSARRRLVVALGCGALVAFAVSWLVPWELTVLVGWDVAALVIIAGVWTQIWSYNAEETRRFAMSEDDTRTGAQFLQVGAGTVSLVAVAVAFLKAHDVGGAMEVVIEAVGIATIALSWVLVHTVYTLRYADLYYGEPEGGIDFKVGQDFEPSYHDFAYTAFTIGMTYQVSDTDINRSEMRRVVLRHALLSFLFGAVILATTVNVIATLLND
jgi:uncharacterized membrane protein